MKKAAITSMGRLLCGHAFSTLWGKYQGARLLDPIVKVYLVLQKTDKLSSKVPILFCIPTMNETSYCSTSLLGFSILAILIGV